MKKLKSSLLNMVLSLTIIAVVAGALLAWVNDVTKSRIEKINERKLSEGICSVMGAEDVVVDSPQEKDEYVFYPVRNRQGSPVGTAVSVVAQGFGGDMKILVGFSPTGEILGYTVLSNAETPGLGAKVTTWFQKNHEGDIVGKNPGKDNLTVRKDGGEVDAITASTITSRAFLNAVSQAYEQLFHEKEEDAQTGASSKYGD